ncbi:MAG: leucyl aminopeptidase [Nitriliruptorales bacterium]|nr:leucyl aminopeptidase [Nitriliruptorales bacterium]
MTCCGAAAASRWSREAPRDSRRCWPARWRRKRRASCCAARTPPGLRPDIVPVDALVDSRTVLGQRTAVLSVSVADTDPLQVTADLLVVPVFKGGIEGPGAAAVLAAAGIDTLPSTPEFRGDIGQTLLLSTPGLHSGGVLLVGLGRMDATGADRLRRAAGVAAKAARTVDTVATTLAQVLAEPAVVQAVAEGFLLGAYEDRRFRTDTEGQGQLQDVVILVPSSQQQRAEAMVQRAEIYVRATVAARDLVNLPPDRKRPADLAAAVTQLVGPSCDVEVLDEHALAQGGFGGLLGVGRGSSAPPRLVKIHYRPDNPLGHVALVGKGITFDTGGLSLKRGTYMATMKSDMAGAAAVAATCSALAALGTRLEVTGLLAVAENMPGADAQRPGDIITIHGGTTVEVLDTDAEGRLVLADALAHAATLEPDAIVDLATLTGTAIHAVGHYAGAVMGTDDELLDALLAAAESAGEPLWQLPLWSDLERLLDTPVADLNNTGDGAGGGAIVAGLFLKRFVGDLPWAHLDIAGPAFLAPEQAQHYLPAGATGYGVRTLLSWLERSAG